MISCEKDGPYIGFSHCPVCSAKYATEMGQTIRKLETALAAMTAERDARDVAIGVLAKEVRCWSTGNFVTHSCQLPNGGTCPGCDASNKREAATSARNANPIARAAVEGEI